MNASSLLAEFEDSIRRGAIVSVRVAIEKISFADVPRPFAADFADIARRVRSETWGLKLLRRFVRPISEQQGRPTSAERNVYAGLLIKAGAVQEARTILLDEVESRKEGPQNSQALMFLSQTYIAEWDYPRAAVYLQELLTKPDADAYLKCVAEVNLIGAYIFQAKFNQAKMLLRKVLRLSATEKWDLLYGNALELSAQLAVIERRWPDAEILLREADERSGQHASYQAFIAKWRALSDLLRTAPGTAEAETAQAKLEIVRQQAVKIGSHETVRDIDFQLALFQRHGNLLLNVYFGTPHVEYKKRIEKIFAAEKWKIPDEYFRKLSSAPAERILDLEDGDEVYSKLPQPLKPGRMLHRLLNILAGDFYKPIPVGELFAKLFPEEFYNPDSAGERVAQAVKLLRRWFEENSVPITVHVEGGKYSLGSSGPYALKVSRSTRSPSELLDSGYEMQLKSLKTHWAHRSFSASKAAAYLDVSASTMRVILKRAVEEGRLFQSGAGRSTLYRFER